MIAKDMNSFTLGSDDYPDWFTEMSKNRVSYNTTSEGVLISLTLTNSTGTIKALTGDTIAQIGNDFLVIPKDAANKYM